MTELIRRLDYERRCKEWLKRRSRLNLETRECRQSIRYLQKREDKLLVQKLARLDMAFRLLGSDYYRNVQVVRVFQRKVSVRSVKFDSRAFRNDTSGNNRANRKVGQRFFRRMTAEDEDEEKAEDEKKMKQELLHDDFQKTFPGVKRSPSPSSRLERGLGLFSIAENYPSEEQNDDFEKRPPSSVSFAVGVTPVPSLSVINEGYDPRNELRPLSVTDTRSSRERRISVGANRRRASTPGPRSNQDYRGRPLSAGQFCQISRGITPNKQPLTSRSRSGVSSASIDPQEHTATAIPSSRPVSGDRVTFREPVRSMSCSDMAVAAAKPDHVEDRPSSAEVTKAKHSYMTTPGSESRSFKVLRDTYRGVYEEDIDPATKRVIALKEAEVSNLKRLQSRVKQLCLQLQVCKL